MNDFERNLKSLFPELYEFFVLAKDEELGGGGETHMWDLLTQLVDMNGTRSSGRISITYTRGRIDSLRVEKDVLAYTKIKPKSSSIDNHEQSKL